MALLERIIAMASNEGDVVLDPFVGGGTTVVAAERLQAPLAGHGPERAGREGDRAAPAAGPRPVQPAFRGAPAQVRRGGPQSAEPYAFEGWLVTQFGGTPNVKRRGDLGLDGTSREGLPLQVKQSEGVGRNVVDNFRAAAERHDAALFAGSGPAASRWATFWPSASAAARRRKWPACAPRKASASSWCP
ncbi:MAG: DNA methyltransferase [Hymenobacter sp.]